MLQWQNSLCVHEEHLVYEILHTRIISPQLNSTRHFHIVVVSEIMARKCFFVSPFEIIPPFDIESYVLRSKA